MAFNRFKRSRRPSARKTRKTRKTYTRKSSKVSTPVKNYVNRMIHNNTENKVFAGYGVNQTLSSAFGTLSGTQALYLLPQISQGVGQHLRIGNEIKIRKAYIRGYVNILPYSLGVNARPAPVMVKMWVVSFKTINTALIASCPTANFFEAGSSSTGFQANMLDMVLSTNNDLITVHRTKTFKIGASSVSTGVPVASYYDNSSFNHYFNFEYGSKCKGTIKYNDTTTNVPENKNMWLLFQVVYPDGSSDAGSVAEYHYTCRVEYEDA